MKCKKKNDYKAKWQTLDSLLGGRLATTVGCAVFVSVITASSCSTLTNLMPNFSTEVSEEKEIGDPLERGAHAYFRELDASGQGCEKTADVIMTIACEKEGIRPCSDLATWIQANGAKAEEIKKQYCTQ